MRTARKRSAADIYHVVARGTGKQLIFEDDSDRHEFLSILKDAIKRESAEIYAWCLMGNHVHLLIHAAIERVSSVMKLLCGNYARYFNDRHGRVGHLFQERFVSEPIEDDEYLLTALRYIHLNPSAAGLADFEAYEWSSYREYWGNAVICSTDFVETLFDGRKDYALYHRIQDQEHVCYDVDRPRSRTRAMPDEEAIELARAMLGGIDPSSIKQLNVKLRNAFIVRLKESGLSICQIERLTGISRSIISKA